MKRVAGVLAMVGAVALAALYNSRARSGPGSPPVSGAAPGPPVVRTCRLDDGAASYQSDQATITLSGVVRSDEDVAISPKVPGRIQSIRVRAGDRVRAGQILATLDIGDYAAQVNGAQAGVAAARAVLRKAEVGKRARAAEMDAAVAEARGGLEIAQAKLTQAELGVPLTESAAASDAEKAEAGVKQAEAGVAQSQAGLRQAEDVVRRLEVLHKHGGVADAELEGARTQAAMARSGYDTALAGLDLARAGAKAAGGETPARRRDVSSADVAAARAGVKTATGALDAALRGRVEALRVADHDVSAASAQLAQARAGLAQARASIGNGILSTPVTGVVTTVSAHAGEYAQPGLAIMHVVALGSLHIEVAAPKRLLSSIRGGQSARVRVATDTSNRAADGSSRSSLPATVSEVAPFMEGGGRSARVRLRFASSPAARGLAELRYGAVVRVDITTDRASEPSVPYTAVRFEGSRAFVMVLVNGLASRRAVILGRSYGERVAILGGLGAADRVIVAPSPSLRDGDAVMDSGH